MLNPDLGAGFGGVHPAKLSEGGQLRPGFPDGVVVPDLENRVLKRLLGELDAERAVKALDAGVGRKNNRQQLFEPAVLPGGIEGPEPPIISKPPPISPQKRARMSCWAGEKSAGRRLDSTMTRKEASSSRVVGKPFMNSPALSTFCRNTDCFEVRVKPVSFMVWSPRSAMLTNL